MVTFNQKRNFTESQILLLKIVIHIQKLIIDFRFESHMFLRFFLQSTPAKYTYTGGQYFIRCPGLPPDFELWITFKKKNNEFVCGHPSIVKKIFQSTCIDTRTLKINQLRIDKHDFMVSIVYHT